MGRGFDSSAVAFHRDGELALDACVVTIGAFDGVHRGHQELLRQTIAAARRRGIAAVVYTFDPPPKVYFGQAEPLISLREKLERIATFAPDHVVVADFNQIYVRRTALDFLAELQPLRHAKSSSARISASGPARAAARCCCGSTSTPASFRRCAAAMARSSPAAGFAPCDDPALPPPQRRWKTGEIS
ncbi:hypothetical protein ACVI1L_006223 [Bradyrhizobium sp. USDA 4516]